MIQHTQGVQGRSSTKQQGYAEMDLPYGEQVCGYIEDNPKSAVLIGMGVGFGAGLLLASLLRSSTEYFSPDESFAERVSHQVADSLKGVLPSSWRSHLKS